MPRLHLIRNLHVDERELFGGGGVDDIAQGFSYLLCDHTFGKGGWYEVFGHRIDKGYVGSPCGVIRSASGRPHASVHVLKNPLPSPTYPCLVLTYLDQE